MRSATSLLGVVLAALLCAAVLVAPSPVAAQDSASRVSALVDQAMADYDMLQLDAAQAALGEAIRISQEQGVRTSAAAQAWVMSGVINYALTGDATQALNPFVEALLIDPETAINPYYATPTLDEIMEQARMIVPAPSEPAPPVQPSPPPQPVQPPPPPTQARPVIGHTPVREGRAGAPVAITVTIPVEVPAARVVLNFKGLRDTNFYTVELAPQPDGVSFGGSIPASATQGQVQVEYFVAAFDRGGQLLGSTANERGPYTVTLLGNVGGPDDRSRDRRSRDRRDSDERGTIAHLSLGAGTGFGLATQSPRANGDRVDLNPGLASTPLHLGFELGIAPTRGQLHLVPFLRMQLVSLDTGTEIEPLGGLKIRYFLQDDRKFRLYAQGGFGYGDVVHFVSLPDIDGGVIDTTVEGPVHIGAGVGFGYFFTRNVALQVDSYLMAMFARTSVHLDVTAGMMFAF